VVWPDVPPIFSGIPHRFAPKPAGFEGGPTFCVPPCHTHWSEPCHVVEGPAEQPTARREIPPGSRVVGERRYADGRRVRGRPVYVVELRWNGGPVSYDVHDAGTDACLTEDESFAHYPTDEDLTRVAAWVDRHNELTEDDTL